MVDREKVIKGLGIVSRMLNEMGRRNEMDIVDDAIALLKEDCHNCKLECLLQKYDELKGKYDELLKEQEAAEGHRIVLEHCAKDTKDVVDEVIENLRRPSDDEPGVCCCAIKYQR